ncbi:MAG: DUF418 domain-containing protein [Pseudomonadota bacterium]|nr:DUF418 domain-containing protein [Pseudomonadota bacterium]
MNDISTGAARGAAPASAGERVGDLDALRGFALIGVFTANFTGYAGDGFMATADQLAALPSAWADGVADFFVRWLVHDKANTLFAFLFGLGFWLQMQRLSARGADFERIYLRRLTILLLFGLVHCFFIFTYDILHLYALGGFALFFLRKTGDRALLIGGLLLAVFGRLIVTFTVKLGGYAESAGVDAAYTDAAVLARQAASAAGDYPALLAQFTEFLRLDWIQNGLFLAWFFYALGRFMVGAWVGRRGWLERADLHIAGFRRWLKILLPAGLAGEFAAALAATGLDSGALPDSAALKVAAEALHLVAAPVLAAGYVCMIVAGLRAPAAAPLIRPLAHVGRMALTNYVTQSLIVAFVLFGVWPGLALAGEIGTAMVLLVVAIGYGAQVAFSGFWLKRFAYGPLEWAWRALTYGTLPRLRLAAKQAAPAAP